MKSAPILQAIIIILGTIGLVGISGGFTKASNTILTQDDRFIGLKTETNFRFPWECNHDTTILKIPSLKTGGGILYLPSGFFEIYNTIEFDTDK